MYSFDVSAQNALVMLGPIPCLTLPKWISLSTLNHLKSDPLTHTVLPYRHVKANRFCLWCYRHSRRCSCQKSPLGRHRRTCSCSQPWDTCRKSSVGHGRLAYPRRLQERGCLPESNGRIYRSVPQSKPELCRPDLGVEDGKAHHVDVLAVPNASEDLSFIMDRLSLPQYMRPAVIVPLEKLPTNSSGKVNRFALKSIPLPRTQETDTHSTAHDDEQLNSTELRLRQLWEQVITPEVLSRYQVTKHSNLFHVGGSSILLVQLRAEVERVFNTTISLFQLFESSTRGGMATLVAPTPAVTEVSTEATGELAPSIVNNKHHRQDDIDWEKEAAVDLIAAVTKVAAHAPWMRPFLSSRFPEVKKLRQRVDEADKFLRPVFAARLEAAKDPDYQKPNDTLEWIIDSQTRFGQKDHKELARYQLAIGFAVIQSTTLATTNMLEISAH